MNTFTLLLSLLFLASSAWAETHDAQGPVYSIKEPDMLEEVMAKVDAKKKSGEYDRMMKEAQDRAKAAVYSPKPVDGVTRAEHNHVFYYDPTIVADRDITMPDGRVAVHKGYKANPLDQQDFGDPMLFLDARDPAQVKFGLKMLKKRKGVLMPVLVGGSFVDLQKEWGHRVYYDQTGFIVRKLGIQHVPALVTQAGNQLKIEEFLTR
jgi:conjugal transfer pilus assembly protein TraW